MASPNISGLSALKISALCPAGIQRMTAFEEFRLLGMELCHAEDYP